MFFLLSWKRRRGDNTFDSPIGVVIADSIQKAVEKIGGVITKSGVTANFLIPEDVSLPWVELRGNRGGYELTGIREIHCALKDLAEENIIKK